MTRGDVVQEGLRSTGFKKQQGTGRGGGRREPVLKGHLYFILQTLKGFDDHRPTLKVKVAERHRLPLTVYSKSAGDGGLGLLTPVIKLSPEPTVREVSVVSCFAPAGVIS
uniref:Uncharacterized protein n=1 Tax=Homalodisca liturata TaxID=320908 RepID=A0A1B6K2Z7_9HEMI